MKFIEYFERSRPTGVKLLLLGGDDSTFKNNLRLEFLGQNPGLDKEYSQTGRVEDLTSSMEAGGFFGPRLFDVLFTGKVKDPPRWNGFFTTASGSEHVMILYFEGEGGDWTDQTFRKHPGILWFDCRFPRTKREKIRLITFLLTHRKITLEDPGLVEEIVERVADSLRLENLLVCLRLLLESGPVVTDRDLRTLLGEANPGFSGAHDLLGGNLPKLGAAIEAGEPFLLLTTWFSVLRKFYIFLCQDSREGGTGDKADEGEEEVGNAPALSRYQLKEYEVASQRYSRQLIREVLEELNFIYQDCRLGRSDHWKERARMTVQKLGVKA